MYRRSSWTVSSKIESMIYGNAARFSGGIFVYFFCFWKWLIRKQSLEQENSHTGKRIKLKILLGMGILGILLYLWTTGAEKKAHYTPDYPMENLEQYLEKEELSKEEYMLLLRQTGLGKAAVDELRKRGETEKIQELQQDFFGRVEICCEPNTIISREELLDCMPQENAAEIPVVEEGDILITFNCHVLGWRVGHAGIVVDAKDRLTLEARVLGSDSAVLSLEHWRSYPSFAVLRLRGVSREERQEIAEYAKTHLADVPYRLTAGIVSSTKAQSTNPDMEEGVLGTQCAHLVWYAYQQYGYDLDSDGGSIVTPKDLFDSPLLEVVQVYGMDVRKLKFYKES